MTAVHTAVVPRLPLTTVLMPWLVTPAPPPKAPKEAAPPRATPPVQAWEPVVKPQTLLAASALPARSVTAVVTVTTKAVFDAKPPAALGTKVATIAAVS